MSRGPVPQIFEDEASALPPEGPAGGDLSGTYPNPTVLDDGHAHTGETLSEITHESVASANIDGGSSTPSLRTLGTGAQQAAAGDDSRLSNARTPTAHASSHQHGGSDEIGSVTPAADAIPKANGSALLDDWISVGGAGFFGDGSDGNVTISGGTSTLGRDMFYASLTVTGSGVLNPGGYVIHVLGALIVESGGKISDPGANATANAGGVGLATRGTLGVDSGAGANGASGVGVGAAGGVGATPNHHNAGSTYQGGAGGGTGTHGGGTGGSPSSRPASAGSIRSWPSAGLGLAIGNGLVRTGGGGGGGGAGGCTPGAGTATSGGGGAGGGAVVIRCRVLDNAGTLSAPGGNGGAASAANGGKAGGGGGGAGGWVIVCAGKVLNQGTINAPGGTGGAGAGGGANGSNGANGFTMVLRGSP